MFLHVSVILSTEGSLHDVISCLAAWSHVPSRGFSVPGPMVLLGVSVLGVLVQRSLFQGGLCPGSLSRGVFVQGGSLRPSRIRKAGGTHPTGMLSCL